MKWEVVETHFEGDKKIYRAVKYNDSNVVVTERTFKAKIDAENYINKLTSTEE
tara:strand:- start:106 stop:264 length:159 start_codon:yes stop_codon:yes gene_type:complete